ncbi:hypothetical protein V6N13_106858 [Hibiscus sabdariffa]
MAIVLFSKVWPVSCFDSLVTGCKGVVLGLHHMDICRELSDLGGTQRQQNLKERSCTEAAPNEETQNGAEKTSAEKRTSAEILGRGRKGNSIRPAIGSE